LNSLPEQGEFFKSAWEYISWPVITLLHETFSHVRVDILESGQQEEMALKHAQFKGEIVLLLFQAYKLQ
jgi:hypothetical protein